MASIDLIVLGMLSSEDLSAYDIQKLVEYRKISEWVKISTPSIYKKVIQLENKGYIKGKSVKEGNFAEKTVYSLTPSGREELQKLMLAISQKPMHMFLDYNAVIVNLMSLTPNDQQLCLNNIEGNIQATKQELEENIKFKEQEDAVPELGMAVLYQQHALATALETWVADLKEKLSK